MNFIFNKFFRIENKFRVLKILVFLPLLIYLGKRSLIAYDEGFYALQAKWILNNENWIMPMWWGDIALDRTIGNQALIAFSQKIFGQSNFSIYNSCHQSKFHLLSKLNKLTSIFKVRQYTL